MTKRSQLGRAAPRATRQTKAGRSLSDNLEAAVKATKNATWTALEELKDDRDILKNTADAKALLQSFT